MKRMRRFFRGLIIETLGVMTLALILGVSLLPDNDNASASGAESSAESISFTDALQLPGDWWPGGNGQ